jgi:hypothetical protein
MAPADVPWIRPGVVVHEPGEPIDGLLAQFALTIRDRGFSVAGYVQRNNTGAVPLHHGCASTIELQDLASGDILTLSPHDEDESAAVVSRLNDGRSAKVDLVVVSRFSAFEKAAGGMSDVFARHVLRGTPVLTSIAGRCLRKWHGLVERGGEMIQPDIESIWRWWGSDRLYQDLVLGVSRAEVRRIVCGPRWLMIESERGCGLAYLPRSPRDLQPRLAELRRMSLRGLAEMVHSWEPLEMAVGIAAINAHYNRYDLDGGAGNGAESFREESGRVIVIGAFPGLARAIPKAVVIETDPRPGELPTIAMDTVVPGCAAIVVTSNTLINRKLPRILQLADQARVALIGPATPMTPRLHDYGIEILAGLVVHDTDGLAAAVAAGAPPKAFSGYGHFRHIRRVRPPRSDTRCNGPGMAQPRRCRETAN